MFTLVISSHLGGITTVVIDDAHLADKAYQTLSLKYTVSLIRTK